MPSWTGFLIFFFIVISLYSGAHFFLYTWFVRMTEPPSGVRKITLGLFALLIVSFPLSRIIGGYGSNGLIYLYVLFSSVWMGLVLYFFLLALASHSGVAVLKLLGVLPRVYSAGSLIYRRAWVAMIIGAVLGIGLLAVWEAKDLQVTHLEIPLKGLSPGGEGFSIVQISDVHYGMLNRNHKLDSIADQVNRLDPDIVVLTGDMVDESVAHLEEMAIPLSKLRSRHGVFAVTGNHEYYAGIQRVVGIMKRANIQVLRNEKRLLPGGIQLLGIDDPTGYRRMAEPKPDFERLLSGLDAEKPSILLYHQPAEFEKTAACGVGLQLSGHTHGGQLYPIRYISRLFYPRVPGLHRIGESFLYVSRGAGTWGPPMRLGSPPEIVHIRLTAKR